MAEEIYPMPSFPKLLVRDLGASSSWYREALGFEHIFTIPGPAGAPALVHLRWVKYADLLLAGSGASDEIPDPRGAGVSLNFAMFDRFEGSVDRMALHARARGVETLSGPVDRPWNVRELTVLDPDGYTLVFAAPLDVGASFDEVVARARGDASRGR